MKEGGHFQVHHAFLRRRGRLSQFHAFGRKFAKVLEWVINALKRRAIYFRHRY